MCILTQKTLFIRWRAWLGLCLAAAAPFPLLAGSGRVNSNGTIDCTINFRFAPDAYDVLDTRNLVIAASQILWDASEAQIRFGKVTLTTGAVNEDLADVWLFAEAGRAGVTFQFDGSGLGQRGRHISYYLASGTGAGLAHQFAHLALGLGDEYRRAGAVGACWGFGPCLEPGALSEQNQCLMQQPEGFTQSEFCTEARHDLVRGDYLNCAARATPGDCDDHCEFFNHATGQYETSQQTAHANASCWRHLGRNFPFLAIPPNLPSAQLPGEFLPPTFVDRLGAGDLVLLILDRSANLARSTESDDGEVCHDGLDNNSNGLFDESPCTPPRLSFLQAAARAWLALANNRGVRAGLVSFNGAATDNAAFQSVNDAHLPTLNSAVNALTAGGGAAIGTALRQSLTRFDNEPGVWNKAAFLFSDGPNTQGEEPAAVAPDLRARGVRVFSISSDSASEDRALPDVAGATGGVPADSPKTTTLVNVFVQQWARYRNLTTPITLRAYNSLNASSAGAFQVAAGTPSVTLIFAGDMADMAGFGVRVGFNGPGGGAFDTATPNPNMRIVGDPYFLLVELRNLTPGTWSFELESAPGAASEQTGHLTIVDENPELELFTILDRHVIADVSVPARLEVFPLLRTPLHRLESLTATLQRPDGVIAPVTLDSDYERGGGGNHAARLTDLPVPGLYRVTVTMRTGPATFSDPGESIYATEPDDSAPVPVVERTVNEYFFVPAESANNNQPTNATVLDLTSSRATVRGSLRPRSDVDYYKITIPSGGRKIWINVDTGGEAAPGATTGDTVVTLLAANGTSVIEEDDDDGSGNGGDSSLESNVASVIAGRSLTNGVYYLKVRAYGPQDVVDPYTLTVVLTSGTATQESESNNTSATANLLSGPIGRRRGAIGSASDKDWYALNVTAGQVLTIMADGDPERDGAGTDLLVELIAPDALTVLFTADSSVYGSLADPAAEGFTYACAESGMYFVRVSRGESGGGNTYELMVAFNDPGRFRFSAPSYRATEDARAATITVERVGGSAGTVTVDFAAFDGSATVPLDYLPVNGTLTFAEGETVKTFTVPIINDALPEGDETVLLILSGATDGATLASPAFAELVLVETGPTPRLTLREDGGNRIISWPVWATGYQLESTVQLEDPLSWQVVTENVSVVGYENQVTLPASSWTMNFFRLRKP